MPRALHVCPTSGCPNLVEEGRCATCKARASQLRGSAASRGYGTAWAKRRRAYLIRHPICTLCPRQATVADHYPESRRELVAAGVPDPDADHRLRALCAPCHASETARNQPGGWNAR
jgi:5-methylcytosine-specific restriction protein A